MTDDPQAKQRREYLATLPKKRMGAGAMLFNAQGQLLVLKPTYKDHWTIPGGVVDADESPRAACVREIREEIGLELPDLSFVAIDYKHERGDSNENLQFMFAGGTLTHDQISSIKLSNDEIAEFQFVDPIRAAAMLGSNLGKRLPYCITALAETTAIYLEDSTPIA